MSEPERERVTFGKLEWKKDNVDTKERKMRVRERFQWQSRSASWMQ